MIKKKLKITPEMKTLDAEVRARAKELQSIVARKSKVQKEYDDTAKALETVSEKLWPDHPDRVKLKNRNYELRDELFDRIGSAEMELARLEDENPRVFGKPWCYRVDRQRNEHIQRQIDGLQVSIDDLRAKQVEPFPPMR